MFEKYDTEGALKSIQCPVLLALGWQDYFNVEALGGFKPQMGQWTPAVPYIRPICGMVINHIAKT